MGRGGWDVMFAGGDVTRRSRLSVRLEVDMAAAPGDSLSLALALSLSV
jgi:hypothetical protein